MPITVNVITWSSRRSEVIGVGRRRRKRGNRADKHLGRKYDPSGYIKDIGYNKDKVNNKVSYHYVGEL